MKHTSTPVSNKQKRKCNVRNDMMLKSVDGNKDVANNIQDSTKSVSQFFDDVSPIEKKLKKRWLRQLAADFKDGSHDGYYSSICDTMPQDESHHSIDDDCSTTDAKDESRTIGDNDHPQGEHHSIDDDCSTTDAGDDPQDESRPIGDDDRPQGEHHSIDDDCSTTDAKDDPRDESRTIGDNDHPQGEHHSIDDDCSTTDAGDDPQDESRTTGDDCSTTDAKDDPQDDHGSAVHDSFSNSTEELDNSFQSDSSTGTDFSFIDEIGTKNAEETISEIRQAVHTYFNKIKKLDIFVEWTLSETLKAEKGIYKATDGLKGPLEPDEASFIKKRLKKFCEEHNVCLEEMRLLMSDKITKFRFPNDLRIKFLQYLCKDSIKDRNPLTVYRAISKFGLRSGKFSEREESFLIEMYQTYSGQHFHSVCGLLLNRHRNNIFRKIERLKKNNSLGSQPCKSNLIKKPSELQKQILENIVSRKYFKVSKLKSRLTVHAWKSIGRECNIPPAIVKAIYLCEIKPQLFSEHPVKLNKFISKLFRRIYASGWKTWEDVKWTQLSNELNDTGKFFIYVLLRKIVMNYVPKENWKNFKECADYLYKKVFPLFENKKEERKGIKLNRIIIKDAN